MLRKGWLSRLCDHALLCLIFQYVGFFPKLSAATQTRGRSLSTSSCQLIRKTTQNGFHRDIVTEVEISGDHISDVESSDCDIMLYEHLPSGIYADLYQLSTRQEFGGPKVLSSTDINVENPEYQSTDHDIYVFPSNVMKEKNRNTLKTSVDLPVHLRYHRPSVDVEFVHVALEHPKILFKCIDDAVIPAALDHISAPCDSTNTSMCDWSVLPCTYNTAELSFKIPVGHQQDTALVCVVTLAVTVLGAIALIYSAVWSPRQQIKSHKL